MLPRRYPPLSAPTALTVAILTLALLAVPAHSSAFSPPPTDPSPPPPAATDPSVAALRTPVDVTFHQQLVVTANSRTGTLSFIDGHSLQPAAEFHVGLSPSAIESTSEFLLFTDHLRHTLHSLKLHRETSGHCSLDPVATASVPRYPVDLAVSNDTHAVAVTSLWSRMLTLLQLDPHGHFHHTHTVPLPFAPRKVVFAAANTVVVADNFGGDLCVVDSSTGKIVRHQPLHGHNIRGLAVNPHTRSLMVTCQTLDSRTFTTYERIFWGVLMQNGLHSLPLQSLLRPGPAENATSAETATNSAKPATNSSYGSLDVYDEPEYDGSPRTSPQRYPLGTPSVGSGDPGAMLVTSDDTTLLLISGTSQIAFRTASHLPFERLPAGRRPESLCLNPEQTRAWIANRFDDSLTVLDLTGTAPAVIATVPLGTRRPATPEETGEQLFYDASLSLDGWFSCHSCHTDGHTNGLLADTFGDEDRGAPKKVLSLLGTGYTAPWAWTGSKTHLEDQIKTSLIISMQTQLPSDQLPVDPLSAFLRSTTPPPSLHFARGFTADPDRISHAQKLFLSAGCSNCHSGSSLTSAAIVDVGIHDEEGVTEFNPPSLRGVSQRGPWFHDGRATHLRDVLESGHHSSDTPLSEDQITLLLELLDSL
ncbi:MAG: cytochrome c peroxidase [Planctomycetota bacterium]